MPGTNICANFGGKWYSLGTLWLKVVVSKLGFTMALSQRLLNGRFELHILMVCLSP